MLFLTALMFLSLSLSPSLPLCLKNNKYKFLRERKKVGVRVSEMWPGPLCHCIAPHGRRLSCPPCVGVGPLGS